MPGSVRNLGLAELADERDIYDILLDHALRGVRVQQLLRLVLVAFAFLTVVVVPPAHDRLSCYLIVAGYAAGAAAVALLSRRGGDTAARFVWLALFLDVVALAALTLVASNSQQQSWTADILVNGFFLIPMLAATQLRPWVCSVVVVPTVLVYFGTSAQARQSNGEPWSSVLLRTAVLAGLAVGCVLLSRVQRSRVLTIGALAVDRSRLLAETSRIEERERRTLAEHLHDGALQYILAARQDLDFGREFGDAASFERVDEALSASSQLLRSTMTELHPAVLEHAGLPAALREFARAIVDRTRMTVTVETDSWPEDLRTSADPLLFATAREFVTNVVKHANADTVVVALEWRPGLARLTVTDDGSGIDSAAMSRRLAAGHVGLATRRARVEAVGGQFDIRAGTPTGTVATVAVAADVKESPSVSAS